MVVCFRDGSGGWRSPVPRGDNTGVETVYFLRQPSLSSPADRFVHRDGSCFLCVVTGSSVFWDFGSLHRGVAASPLASCCGSGKLNERRCGVLAADCCCSGPLSFTDIAASQCQLLRQRHQRNDVAASLEPASAAEAIGKRKAVASSVADCCGSGFPRGQDVAASLMCRRFWTTVPVLHCFHEPSASDSYV